MKKEIGMLNAHILKGQGLKQHQIAEQLGVTERTVRNYLKSPPTKRKDRKVKSKLDSYREYIKSIIEDDNDYNCALLFEKLQKMGYSGKTTILGDYVQSLKNDISRKAVIRFETIPGEQAQMDWKELGYHTIDGKRVKVYAFVMILGYSRRFFVRFTTSMKQHVLHQCHMEAFEYFEGIPASILYDNMKTAFICDGDGVFKPNKQLLTFAVHYGFQPVRCKVRRPQTKGKVERSIGFVNKNFLPRISWENATLDSLQEQVVKWLTNVDKRVLRDFSQSRNERFEEEIAHLQALPVEKFNNQIIEERIVSSESLVMVDKNYYSVPVAYMKKSVTIKIDSVFRVLFIFDGSTRIRSYELADLSLSYKRHFHPDDKKEVVALHSKQFYQKKNRIEKVAASEEQVEIGSPSVYDSLMTEEVTNDQ